MGYSAKINLLLAATALLTVLAACGKSSTSTTTIPSSESVYYAFNLVFRNSTTLSTGYNAFGQLGTGNLDSRNSVGYLDNYYNFKAVATGGNFAVAIDNAGRIMAWGYNAFGQLGNNTTTYSSRPVFNNFSRSVATAIAAGAQHTLALRNDNTLWAWGRNNYGQLGQPISVGQSNIPVRITPDFQNISSIAANAYNSAVRAGGKVWSWGLNDRGQLGLDSKKIPYLPYSSAGTGSVRATAVSGLPAAGIKEIAVGGASYYALAWDGTVWGWGNNYNGQLGNGDSVDSFVPVQSVKMVANNDGNPEIAGPLTGVVKIAAGTQHAVALLNDGTVWAWGMNDRGQLGSRGPRGLNMPTDKNQNAAVQVWAPEPATAGYLSGATDIKVFGSSSMARIGNVWYVWGDNTHGQLGTGSAGYVSLPVRMIGF